MDTATSGDVFVSGGYDHCVKLWDSRLERKIFSLWRFLVFSLIAAKACVLSMPTSHPVSSVLQLNSSVVLAASDNAIYVFDLLGTGR